MDTLSTLKICRFCQKPLVQKEKEHIHHFNTRIFCDCNCAAKHRSQNKPKKIHLCPTCRQPKSKNGKTCVPCFSHKTLEIFGKKTKGYLFLRNRTWQAARSTIQRNARLIYENSNQPKKCIECGYNKHYEICHIKSVSSFPNSTLLSEINSIENLKALCPNHHWEFDNLVAGVGIAPTEKTL